MGLGLGLRLGLVLGLGLLGLGPAAGSPRRRATLSQTLGAVCYKMWLKRLPLRPLFGAIVALTALLQLTQLMLITRSNLALGLPDVAFALGDDALIEVAKELLAMPMLLMMAALCPAGATSTVFALLTSVQMAGATVRGSLSSTPPPKSQP